jgi:hypothetical protein
MFVAWPPSIYGVSITSCPINGCTFEFNYSYSSKGDKKLLVGANLVFTKSHLEKSLTIVDNGGYYFDIDTDIQ